MLVFVYGTLKQGGRLHHELSGSSFVGPGVTLRSDFSMRNTGWYPAVLETNQDGRKVQGELYKVTEKTRKRLDAVEGVPDLYRRKTVYVQCQSGVVPAEMYVGDHKTFGHCQPLPPKDGIFVWEGK